MAIKNYDVLYKSQSLNQSEKTQVLTNIGAFTGNYADLTNKPDLTQYATTSALQTLNNAKVDKVAGSTLMSATDKAKLDGIDDDAEVNVIDEIKVNGTEVQVTNKSVDITVPSYTAFDGSADGLVPKPPSTETIGARIMTDSGAWVPMPEGKTYTNGNGINISGTVVSVKPGTGVTVDANGVNVDGSEIVEGTGISIAEKEDGTIEISATGESNVIEHIQANGSELTITNKTVNLPLFSANAPGLVPAVGTNTGKYLKGDGTWNTPAGIKHGYMGGDKTVDLVSGNDLMIPAFNSSDAMYGVVPAPILAVGKYLKDDGTWDTPAGGASYSEGAAIEIDTTTAETPTISVKYGAGLTVNGNNELCASAGSTYNVELESSDSTLRVVETDDTDPSTQAITKKAFDVSLALAVESDVKEGFGHGLAFAEKTVGDDTYKVLGIDPAVIATVANVQQYCVMKAGDTMTGDLNLEKDLVIKSSTAGEGDAEETTLGKIIMYPTETVDGSFYGLDTKSGIAIGDGESPAIQSFMVRRKASDIKVVADLTVSSMGYAVLRQKADADTPNQEDMSIAFGKRGSSYDAFVKEGNTQYNIVRGATGDNQIKYQSIVTEKPTSNIIEGMVYFVME